MHTGTCLCGAVRFKVKGELGSSDACHCTLCRKWTGHFLPSTEVQRTALTVQGEEHLSWHQSSEKARRGFCAHCGSSLFFDPLDRIKHGWTGIALGAFDTPTEAMIARHIFVAEKGDYYTIDDRAPQNEY